MFTLLTRFTAKCTDASIPETKLNKQIIFLVGDDSSNDRECRDNA